MEHASDPVVFDAAVHGKRRADAGGASTPEPSADAAGDDLDAQGGTTDVTDGGRAASADSGLTDPADGGPAIGASCGADELACGNRCIPAIEPIASSVQSRIFATSCGLSSSCHQGISAKEGLDLSTLDGIAAAVGSSSQQKPGALVIAPGDAAASYLIAKLRGVGIAERSSTGQPTSAMPPAPNEPLCEAKIAAIEEWINTGAPFE